MPSARLLRSFTCFHETLIDVTDGGVKDGGRSRELGMLGVPSDDACFVDAPQGLVVAALTPFLPGIDSDRPR